MNQNEFPRMLYRAGGTEEIHGGKFSTLTVRDAGEQADALTKGWHLTTPEAVDAEKDAVKAAGSGSTGDTSTADNAPPTRDEMKAKATEMGLEFAGNISNANLAALIADALAKG